MAKVVITAPFISKVEIVKAAENFRNKHWSNIIPVDIEKIIEQKLSIEIIPVPDLMKLCFADALITSDWKKIYVDNEKYMDERWEGRLRFSLAHEVGHLVLHKNLYTSFGIESFSDFYDFFEKIDQQQYNFIEGQANKFASYLLIPNANLQEELDILLADKKIPENTDQEILNHVLAGSLCEKFNVSVEALEKALTLR